MNKLISWNVNSIRARMPGVEHVLSDLSPDILALQETKVEDDVFPEDHLQSLGYHSYYIGQPSYNGVALISKQPIKPLDLSLTEVLSSQKRIIAAQWENKILINVYVPMGESLASDKFKYKLAWLHDFSKLIDELMQEGEVLICGDINIAPSDIDVYDPTRWEGQVLVSPEEREVWQSFEHKGLVDVFRYLYPEDPGFTWWDYRRFAYRRNAGLRIDHWLSSKNLLDSIKHCQVHEAVRQHERPSDHAPLELGIV